MGIGGASCQILKLDITRTKGFFQVQFRVFFFFESFFYTEILAKLNQQEKIVKFLTREIKISKIFPISLSKNSFTNTNRSPRVFEIPRTDGSLILLCFKYQKTSQFFRFWIFLKYPEPAVLWKSKEPHNTGNDSITTPLPNSIGLKNKLTWHKYGSLLYEGKFHVCWLGTCMVSFMPEVWKC